VRAVSLPANSIQRDSPVPFYFQLSELLEQEVTGGRWEPRFRLASEPEPCLSFGVSRTTIRPALRRLKQRRADRAAQGPWERDLSRLIPLGRMGSVDDVAHWVWWLSAPDTEWTTGNVVHVDGGQVLGTPEAAGG
jgi:DNA-binding transcriptional MocR family regulator